MAQTLVFGYLSNPASTTAEMSQAAVGVMITRQGIDRRFTAGAAVFLERVRQAMVEMLEKHGYPAESLPKIHSGFLSYEEVEAAGGFWHYLK